MNVVAFGSGCGWSSKASFLCVFVVVVRDSKIESANCPYTVLISNALGIGQGKPDLTSLFLFIISDQR